MTRGPHHPPTPEMSRRKWLRVNLAAGLGLAAPIAGAGAPTGAGGDGFGRAKSVLLVYASGGQSQIDMWDPKPDAPAEVRGEFGTVATSVPGLRFGEHIPRIAKLAKHFTVLRSVSHDDLDHGSAGYLALTGQYHPVKSGNPPARPTDLPTYGAILQQLTRERKRPAGRLPFEAVHVNGPAHIPEIVGPGQFAGLLGKSCEPLLVGDPTEDLGPVAGLDAWPDVPAARLQGRRALLSRLDANAARDQLQKDRTDLYGRAYDLLAAPAVRSAFDLSKEPAALRERYGRHRAGQGCLLARRLVEAGVPWVTLIWNHNNRGQDRMPDNPEAFGWDTHNDIFEVLRNNLLPRFDQSFSALLEDMNQRGLLDRTLVICMGEFGRAPLVKLEGNFAGSTPGRKHWPHVYSIVLAGAGVSRGAVFGASDAKGAYPAAGAVGPWDVAATMFHALGIDPASHYTDPTNRPYPVSIGKPIFGLYGG